RKRCGRPVTPNRRRLRSYRGRTSAIVELQAPRVPACCWNTWPVRTTPCGFTPAPTRGTQMAINDDDITTSGAQGEGIADGGSNPGGHDGGADGSAHHMKGEGEGLADGGSNPDGHDGGADGSADGSANTG